MDRAGIYVDNFSGDMSYRSFRPDPLPPTPELMLSAETDKLVIEANRRLAKLDAAAELIPDMDLFISMYVRKEALLSSQIEGTQCTLEDVLDPDADANVNLDVADVVNYVSALQFAQERLETLPLCCRFIKEVHAELMKGVRGSDKSPGEFRHSQNWIGPAGCSLRNARYVPPNVPDMVEAMADLEKYINEDWEFDPLVRAALIHYQFETIHPFLDGNGRVGRMLVLLYLMDKGLLQKPVLYISYFLKKNQMEYYDRMSWVRSGGNYEQWIHFFLEAVSEAAEDGMESVKALLQLHEQNLSRLPDSKRKRDIVRELFAYIQKHPIIDVKRTASELGISYNTAASAVKKLQELEILKEKTNKARNRVYIYEDYVNILKKGL
ncbi:MAG: Fic family protein [Firmicutes bacterium]|nr:Fic family protein [Bacillota bacterium]MBR6584175.1 Fic family protein [Bacillota bacterium]